MSLFTEPPSKRHTCPTCCQALSYIDDCLRHDMDLYAERISRWRHPIFYYVIGPRIRDYAASLLDESGK